jgi:hypothetical protein
MTTFISKIIAYEAEGTGSVIGPDSGMRMRVSGDKYDKK